MNADGKRLEENTSCSDGEELHSTAKTKTKQNKKTLLLL
jgi:hypothetical protein